MEPNVSVNNTPVNFFVGGGRYISDSFNMELVDTSNPNAFDNLTLNSIIPDMVDAYVSTESAKQDTTAQEHKEVGFFEAIKNFFTAPAPAESQS